MPLCKNDPIVSTLRDTFHANVLRVPEERFKPLIVLSTHDSKTFFTGSIDSLLSGAPITLTVPIANSRAADVSGKRTKSVDVKVGLDILQGFLKAVGLSTISLTANFDKVKTVSFSFTDVNRQFLDLGVLGKVLSGRALDTTNLAVTPFLDNEDSGFHVIDSVFTSDSFTVHADDTTDAGFAFNVPTIQNVVGNVNANVKLSTAGNKDITFKNGAPLTFAFSCVKFNIAEDGRITAMLREDQIHDVFGIKSATQIAAPTPARVLLTLEPELLSIEEPQTKAAKIA
jgi:hypothetical protein